MFDYPLCNIALSKNHEKFFFSGQNSYGIAAARFLFCKMDEHAIYYRERS